MSISKDFPTINLCWNNDSPILLLVCNPGARITISIQHKFLVGKSFDIDIISITVVFFLQDVQKVTPFFIGKVEIFLIFFFHIILHELSETFLFCDANFILSGFMVMDYPTLLVKHVSLIQRLSQVLGYIVHLSYAIGLMEDAFHNGRNYTVVDIFHMAL